ncbi:MAG: P27 family phage terminase small subunit [Actinomycetota bacterium]|nr:P27 family phage terminase small subunit [Actinomycetota bacterium]
MRGRKPKPTHLKIVTGNPGRRKINTREPVPTGPVVRPAFLVGRRAEIWDEYAPALVALKVLSPIDAHTFATWCCLAAELEEDPAGMLAARISQMRALASSFGLDASARARLGLNGKEKDEDPAAAYFGR